MTASLLAVLVLEAAFAALVAVAVHVALSRRARRPVVVPKPDETTPAWFQRLEGNWPVFRRPAEFGSLMRPWDEVTKIRKAIMRAQLAPSDDVDLACIDFSARRCWLPNASYTFRRTGYVDLKAGRVPLRRWLVEPDAGERFDHWLEQWDENPLVALTGNGVAA